MRTPLLQSGGQPVDLPLGETDNCLFNFGQRAHGNNLAHCVDETTLMQQALTLHVEAELDDVAVLDGVFFAFDAEFACIPNRQRKKGRAVQRAPRLSLGSVPRAAAAKNPRTVAGPRAVPDKEGSAQFCRGLKPW